MTKNLEILKLAFETGYTDEDYDKALKEFFGQKEAYEKMVAEGEDFIEFEDSIFYTSEKGGN